MALTPEQFNKALEEFQLFGPRRRIPILDRWREILPDVNPSEFQPLLTQCKEIESFALSLAENVRDGQTTDIAAQKQLANKYPFLTETRLGHTWSQAVYFSLK